MVLSSHNNVARLLWADKAWQNIRSIHQFDLIYFDPTFEYLTECENLWLIPSLSPQAWGLLWLFVSNYPTDCTFLPGNIRLPRAYCQRFPWSAQWQTRHCPKFNKHLSSSQIFYLIFQSQFDLIACFDTALVGIATTFSVLDEEMTRLNGGKNVVKKLGFRLRARYIWNEDLLKEVLQQYEIRGLRSAFS